MPRVSVIVPAHNSAAHIEQTLRSVQAQTFEDWELVLADDASCDETLAIARRFEDARVRVVASEVNLGPAAARNLALTHARGELVAFLDADDLWLPEYLECQVERFDACQANHRRIGIVACNARLLDGDRHAPGTYYDQFRRPFPVTLERVLRRNVIFISSMVPRAVGEEVGWFAPELFGTEDHDLWIRILERGYTAEVGEEVLAVYRRADGSVSSNIARMAANNQATYRRALARGRLTPRQRRIARSELRYNRAMEAVARAAFDRRAGALARAGHLTRTLPALAFVAATRPRHWGDWLRVLAARRPQRSTPADA